MSAILIACLLLSLCAASGLAAGDGVVIGDEQFEAYLPILEGKRVALFTNHTGINSD